jgi:hypothetical protein
MDKNSVQLRFRSAFRYGYYAFLAVMAGIVLSIFLSVDGLAFLDDALLSPVSGLIGMVGLGLVVPLFLLAWLLASFAVMPNSIDGQSSSI